MSFPLPCPVPLHNNHHGDSLASQIANSTSWEVHTPAFRLIIVFSFPTARKVKFITYSTIRTEHSRTQRHFYSHSSCVWVYLLYDVYRVSVPTFPMNQDLLATPFLVQQRY